jgi:type IV pilus assembly protein PilC
MEFRCRLGTPSGQLIDGVYAAESEAQLRREFEEKGLLLLSVRPAGLLANLAPGLVGRRRVRTRDFLEFCQELATLLKAGMPLVQSLDLLRRDIPDAVLKPIVDNVYERVKAGAQLSDAFEEHGDLVPRMFTASLVAGERSGNLETVIRRYVTYARLIGAVRRRTLSALLYPAVLLGLAVVVVGIIVLRLVPAFASFYSSFQAELPLMTRIIIGLSGLLQTYFPFIVLTLVGAGVMSWTVFKRPAERKRLDRAILGLPLVGVIARKFATSQMARTLATLLGGGIPLVQALDVASRSVGNRYVAGELQQMAERVREGQGLSATMRDRGVFPDVAVKMTEVGESTGSLQDMLNSLADFYDEELETSLERFVTLVEPVLLILLGIVIAALLLALYLPLFQLSSVVK